MRMLGRTMAMGAALAGALLVGTAGAQAVTPMAKLDQSKYLGLWYEIARLPVKAEKKCVGDAMVIYAEADKAGRFQVVNSCQIAQGYKDVRNANAKPENKLGDGRIKVTYVWPFRHKNWVLAVGNTYEWALVGSPNHKTLWVYSRTAAMDPDLFTVIVAKASAQGFDATKLVMTPQTK